MASSVRGEELKRYYVITVRYIHADVLALPHFTFDSLLLVIYATDYLFPRFYFPLNLVGVSMKKLGE